MVNLGHQIRTHRLRQGLRQEDIAIRMGTSRTYVSLIELNRVDPSLNKVTGIAAALGLTVIELLTDIAPPGAESPAAAAD